MIPAKYWSPTKRLMLLGAMTGGKAVEDTATGNPLTFLTDLARPLKSLLIPFTPKQSGSGDPSPSNIRPIAPWNGLTVKHGGKNLFNKDDPNVQLNKRVATGGTIINSQYSQAVTGFIPVKEGAKYIINNYINQNYFSCFYSEKDITKPIGAIFGNDEYPKTAPKGAKYLIVTIGNVGIDSFQIEVGQTATAYEPYKPITETALLFPETVYGGTLDVVSGVLTVEWESKTFDGSENWTAYNNGDTTNLCYYVSIGRKKKGKGNLLCDKLSEYTGSGNLWDVSAYLKISGHPSSNNVYCTAEEPLEGGATAWREWLSNNPLQIVYELDAPVEIQLTQQEITALKGNNTLWSDADGDMIAVYFKKA